MNVNHFNLFLLAGWLLITIGAICVHWAAGIAISGLVLILLTLLVSAKFGVFQTGSAKKTEGGDQ